MKLICFDMDGIIFKQGNFWVDLHKAFGTLEEGKELTKKYLATNYQKLVEEVIGRLWKGKDAKIYFDLIREQQYLPNVQETLSELKKRGYKIALISSGPKELAERAQREVGVDYIYTNTLLIKNNQVVGSTSMEYWPILSGSKVDALKELCDKHHLDLKDVIVVGHEDNDIKMCKVAGFSIALNSESEELKKYCNAHIEGDISKILPRIDEFERK